MVVLENTEFVIQCAMHGAELKSVFHKPTQTEFMWQANPAVWARTSPVLFPIVGKLLGNQLRVNSTAYQMGQHGFARDCDFDLVKQSSQEAHFRLSSSAHTLLYYPYNFVLEIIYRLHQNELSCNWLVTNKGNATMHFSIGAHPGFNLPGGMSQYELVFEQPETASRIVLSEGLFSERQEPFFIQTAVLPLETTLFDKDALVFTNLQSERVTIRNKHSTYAVDVSWQDFAYLGIWSAKGCDAFVCIEPWCGHADMVNGHSDISSKPGMQSIEPGEVFSKKYGMRFQY
ncbi:MAG: aldose 1-epimerase family protein [Bacteroidota bacterium]|jgi:galactose mutarotase-like enzyme|nr:aldose 1-epimerase family protein [Sphingobacteriales bacterium]